MCLGLDYLILASGGYALVSGMEFYEVVGFALRGGYIEGYIPSTLFKWELSIDRADWFCIRQATKDTR
jgi:hypothetical protein